jgi:diguanylate cyclase
MSSLSSDQQVQQWRLLLAQFPASLAVRLQELVERHQAELAGYFYEQMLADEAASQFLSHDEVKLRLDGALQRWLRLLFSASMTNDLQPLVALQKQVGEIHARIGVPVHLVLQGAGCLKGRFYALLEDEGWSDADSLLAQRMFVELIDHAMEIISRAYATSHDRNARNEEAYRLFSVAQNVGAEKERQRAALLDWENQLMFDLAMGLESQQLPRLCASEFGLWFRHKGAYAFQGTTEVTQILESMERIDNVLLPMFGGREGDAEIRMQRLRDLREQAKSVVFHLDTLFEQVNELESGRDVLTRMLNRKFLPVVMSKEVTYSRKSGRPFAVLAIDIDHFKMINDTHGHEAGDLVLQQVALLLSNHSRGGDYVFRLGGEEFLMLLVDISGASAVGVADKLRRQVEKEVFRLPREQSLKLTISVGVAGHDGHPDYQNLLRAADEALYRAKHGGRNRVELA